MQHHKYSLTELENMMPWVREIYVGLLQQYIKEENEKLRREKIYWILMTIALIWRMVSQDFHCTNEKSQNPQLRG